MTPEERTARAKKASAAPGQKADGRVVGGGAGPKLVKKA